MGPQIKYTDRLILKVENESNAQAVLNLYLRNKRNFEEFEPTRPNNFYTLEYHTVAMAREAKAYRLGFFLRYYLYKKDDPTFILGAVNFNFMNDSSGPFVEVGYKIDHAYQNMGYAYEACQAAFSIIKQDYHVNRIDARIHPENRQSLRLAEKLGFTYLRLEPQSANILGSYVDLCRYTLDISKIQ